jgi:ribosomal protein S18 acetylase RimI-like enzyme
VRVGTPADAPRAAALHAEGIAQGFLSLLGPRFLTRLYRRICLTPDSFLLVAERDAPVGFIAGSTDVGALYRTFLWRDGAVAAALAARHLLVGWRRVFETLRHGDGGGPGSGRGAELLAVAVDRRSQGLGVGRQLVAAFLAEVSARGSDAAHVVVGADNTTATALYERAGFTTVERFELHPGTESLLLQWDRPGTASAPGSGAGGEG